MRCAAAGTGDGPVEGENIYEAIKRLGEKETPENIRPVFVGGGRGGLMPHGVHHRLVPDLSADLYAARPAF